MDECVQGQHIPGGLSRRSVFAWLPCGLGPNPSPHRNAIVLSPALGHTPPVLTLVTCMLHPQPSPHQLTPPLPAVLAAHPRTACRGCLACSGWTWAGRRRRSGCRPPPACWRAPWAAAPRCAAPCCLSSAGHGRHGKACLSPCTPFLSTRCRGPNSAPSFPSSSLPTSSLPSLISRPMPTKNSALHSPSPPPAPARTWPAHR